MDVKSIIKSQWLWILLLTALVLQGCASKNQTDQAHSTKYNKSQQDKKLSTDLRNAIAARGYVIFDDWVKPGPDTAQCATYDLIAHRGSTKYPENSLLAISHAFANGFDVVEIDVRVTRDNVWVLHHDEKTGRATGAIDNNKREIERTNYQKEWGYLRLRNMQSGQLTDIMPPTFLQAARLVAGAVKSDQRLNIEIKSKANQRELELLNNSAMRTLNPRNFYYSSSSKRVLETMRSINPNVFLSYIDSPTRQSMRIAVRDLERGAGSDSHKISHKDKIERFKSAGSRHYDANHKNSHKGLKSLRSKLGRNIGFAIDIRRYMENPQFNKSLFQYYDMPVATYTINGNDYHEAQLRSLNPQTRPEQVIIDDSYYGFCKHYIAPQKGTFTPVTKTGEILQSLPIDLDLERISEIDIYYAQGVYPSIDGTLKPIPGREIDRRYKPVFLDSDSAVKQKERDVELNTADTIKIDLKEKDQ